MRSTRIRNHATNFKATICAECAASLRNLFEGTVNPCQACRDECFGIASRARFADAQRHHRLKSYLWIDAQTEPLRAGTADQGVRSLAHQASVARPTATNPAGTPLTERCNATHMSATTTNITAPLGGPSRFSRRQRAAIYATVFLSFIDNFALLPVIGPRTQSLGGTPLLVGLAIAAYSLANLAFDPIGGALADRFGRRRVIVISLVISPIAIAIYALADSLPLFMAARVIHGASGGVLSAAIFALLGDAAPIGQRGRQLGRAGALIGIAAVLGPGGAAIVSNLAGPNAVFLGVAAIIAVGLAITLPLLPETFAPRETRVASPGAWRRILSKPALRVALVAIFGLEAAVGSITGFIKDGLIARALAEGRDQAGALRYAAGASGGLFTIFGIVAIAIMLSRVSTRVDQRGPFGISVVGLGALAGALALLAVSPTLTVDLIAMLLYGIGYGLIFPAAAGAVAIATQPEERGRGNGALNLSFDIGISAGPILGGLIATFFVGVTAFAGGLALVLAALLVLPLVGRGRSQVPKLA